MVTVNLYGYCLNKGKKRIKNNVNEFCFFVSCKESVTGEQVTIPCIARGDLADECFRAIDIETMVGIVGSLYINGKMIYVIVQNVEFKQPKSRRMDVYSSTEFYRLMRPKSSVIEVMNDEEKN